MAKFWKSKPSLRQDMPVVNILKSVYAISFFAASSIIGNANAGMIDKDGMAPYEICALCHSLDGVSRMAKFPKLAGQPALYIEKQIRDFLSGRRTNDGGQMAAIVTEIDVETIGAIAEWFSFQKAPQPDDPEGNAEGAQLFVDYKCNTCHGGVGRQAPFMPYLNAQHEVYLTKQMKDFRNGERTNDDGKLMQKAMATISNDEISKIAIYLASIAR
jgi:cytochrome c553